MIHVIITSYNEPKATLRAINAVLNQKTKEKFEVVVVDPFPETEKFILDNIPDKRVKFFLDPGEGKSYALNLLIQEYGSQNKDDLFIFTDGDVYISENSVQSIVDAFKDPTIGCVTGRPITIDTKETKYGYWSHLLFDGIHKVRQKLSDAKQFFECSGYLFAIRKNVIMEFPIEASEDSIIPYLFWKKGYKIKYIPEAEVYVKNPANWGDWKLQKIRNIKGHEHLNKIVPDMPRTKSFFNEIKKGAIFSLTYPKSPKEFFWTTQLYPARLYIYMRAFSEIRKNKEYSDGWREKETESTKPLD